MNSRSIRRAAERLVQKAARNQQINPEHPPEPPVSEAQLAANRANAQFSTGPTSDLGKSISSRNNTRHGLTCETTFANFQVLPNENQSDYDHALNAFFKEWQPVTPTEVDLVERMVIHSWLRRRATRLQDELLINDDSQLRDYKNFELLGRYHTTHARACNKAFSDLLRLRNFQMRQQKEEALLARRAQDLQIRFESQKRKAEEHAVKMETLNLKQQAQRQRNERLKMPKYTNIATAIEEESPTSASA